MLEWVPTLLFAVGISIILGIYLRMSSLKSPAPEHLDRFVAGVWSTQIAHRGGGAEAPENTMCAFRNAVSHGVKTIEIDIQYTSDEIPIVIHDETLDRTTNGTGLTTSHSLDHIMTLNANLDFPQLGECKIPTLDETIEFAIENDIILLFDVKGGGYCKLVAGTIDHILHKYPHFKHKFAIISFFPDILYTTRTQHPTIITGYTRRHDHIQVIARTDHGYTGVWSQRMLWCVDRMFDYFMFYVFVPLMRINMFEIRKSDVTENYVADVAPRPILTWTVNDMVEKKYFKHLGCAVMSDIISDTDAF